MQRRENLLASRSDEAQNKTEIFTLNAVNLVRARVPSGSSSMKLGEDRLCVDCGEIIPLDRRLAGINNLGIDPDRCSSCQGNFAASRPQHSLKLSRR